MRVLRSVSAGIIAIAVAVAAPPPAASPVLSAAPADAVSDRSLPGTVVVIGDSISQGTGADGPGAPDGGIGAPRPAASWATGDHRGLESYADRLDRLSGTAVRRINLSANGASMRDDFYAQITSVPADADLVLIQMGGNDLCRSSESDITPAEVYEREFTRGLDWLVEHRPDTLIVVGSVPDVYSLWYVRGAPHVGESRSPLGLIVGGGAGPRPARTAAETDNMRWARLLWNTLGVVPCASVLDAANRPTNSGPTPDPNDPAEARRLRVRAINEAYNEILERRCAVVLRCRFDGGAVFDLTANRDRDGVLLGDPTRWTFTDADISTQDHFHPSLRGQAKLAEVIWESGFDFTDTTAPNVELQYPGIGMFTTAVSYLDAPRRIRAIASDDRGVRGLEYRSAPVGEDRSGRPWQTAIGTSVGIEIDAETDLEVRAVDVNGNVSDPVLTRFMLDTEAPSVEVVLASGERLAAGGGAAMSNPGVGDQTPGADGDGDGDGARSAHQHLAGPLVTLNGSWSATASCRDRASGVARCVMETGERRQVLDTSTVGGFEVSAEAIDRVGNRAVDTARYQTVYRWSSPWLSDDGDDRRFGRVAVVRVGLSDADDAMVRDADVTLLLIDPEGRRRPVPSPAGVIGLDELTWSEAHGGYIAVVGTATLSPGEWTLVVEADDQGRIERTLSVG